MMLLNPKNMNYISKFIYTILLFNFFICFSQDNESHVERELDKPGRDEHTEKLFDQDSNEEEDFEIPAFLRKQKF